MIFHIPHSSRRIPVTVRPRIVLADEALQRELLLMTDAFTEELFSGWAENGDAVVAFPLSRLVVDPERFVDDAAEPMAERGMGAIYTRTSGGDALRLPVEEEERNYLLTAYYRPHHKKLTHATTAELERLGRALIIDCHSFSSTPLPHEPDQTPNRPDICIGTDDFHSSPEIEETAIAAAEREGLRVEKNRPFGGALVPGRYYQREPRVQAIMIEVNRKLYMDEETGEKNSHFSSIRTKIGQIVEVLRRWG